MSRVPRSASRSAHVLAIVAVVAAVVAGALVGVAGNRMSFDLAASRVAAATVTADEARREAAAEESEAAARWTAALRISLGADGLVDPVSGAALAARTAGAEFVLAAATFGTADLGEIDPAGSWPTDPFGLIDQATSAARSAESSARVSGMVTAVDGPIDEAALAVLRSVPDSAARLEVEAIQARNPAVIDVRETAAKVAATEKLTPEAADVFSAYVAAADRLRASHRDELAAKAGPLLDARLAVEEFARSMAGGVLIHVDWAPEVNGFGGSTGLGGETTWAAADGGQAAILLSNSVAERWPSETAKELVAHEVGHAISAKCWRLFDWSDRAANEQWATAWAISLGYTGSGNGAALYGQPPDALIAMAATCR